ncbi:hypothetical protein NKH18_12070 [Streptomyces sp. M10(2022)]
MCGVRGVRRRAELPSADRGGGPDGGIAGLLAELGIAAQVVGGGNPSWAAFDEALAAWSQGWRETGRPSPRSSSGRGTACWSTTNCASRSATWISMSSR